MLGKYTPKKRYANLNLKPWPDSLFWCQVRAQHHKLPQKQASYFRGRQQCHVKEE